MHAQLCKGAAGGVARQRVAVASDTANRQCVFPLGFAGPISSRRGSQSVNSSSWGSSGIAGVEQRAACPRICTRVRAAGEDWGGGVGAEDPTAQPQTPPLNPPSYNGNGNGQPPASYNGSGNGSATPTPLGTAPGGNPAPARPIGQGAISAEIVEMFQEAQTNILELNQARISALEQLQLARARVADLEERVIESEAYKARVDHVLAIYEIDPYAPLPGEEGYAGPPITTILLRYKSGWGKSYLHFRADGGEWTMMPGVKMEQAEGRWMQLEIGAQQLEFVITDGAGNWDKAPDGGNYMIEGAGTFSLEKGRLRNDEK